MRTVERTTAYKLLWVRNTDVFVIGIRLLPVGVVMCNPAERAVERAFFGPLCSFTLTKKASTIRNSANIVLGL